MAIYLQTGVPGAGKTSFALAKLLYEDLPKLKAEGRPIYTSIDMTPESLELHGIIHLFDVLGPGPKYDPGRPDKKAFDPEKIHSLPVGSYIIVDEAQFVFPSRSAGSKVPSWVSQFETHRHRGHDFLLITQSPAFLDHHFRGMYERHVHYSRIFGSKNVVEFTYEGYCAHPEPELTSAIAQRKTRRVNPKVFENYVSTAKNTHASRFPWGKVLTACLVLFGSLAFGWWSIQHAMFSNTPDDVSSSEQRLDCAVLSGMGAGRVIIDLPNGRQRLSGTSYTVSGSGAPQAFGSFPSTSDLVVIGPDQTEYPVCST